MDNIKNIDTSHKDFAFQSAQRKKEIFEQMKQEAMDASQRKDEMHQQMKSEFTIREIIDTDGCNINEFGEIERPDKAR